MNKTDLADDKTFFVVTGGRFAQAMAEALKTCEQKDGPQVFFTAREDAIVVLKRLVFGQRPPCVLYFKASRAEALENLLKELEQEF